MGDSGPPSALRLGAGALRAPRASAWTLAAVSGLVDAYVYVEVTQVFVANQSGNLVFAGVAAGQGRWGELWSPVVAVAAYLVGAGLAVRAFDRAGDDEGRRRLLGVLGAEAVLLAGLLAALLVVGTVPATGRPALPALVVVAWTGVAMGAQSIVLRRAAGVPTLTTAGTGALSDLGTGLGRLGRPTAAPTSRSVVVVVGCLLGCYVGGAALGSLLVTSTGLHEWMLALPLLLVAVVAWVAGGRRSDVRWPSGPAR